MYPVACEMAFHTKRGNDLRVIILMGNFSIIKQIDTVWCFICNTKHRSAYACGRSLDRCPAGGLRSFNVSSTLIANLDDVVSYKAWCARLSHTKCRQSTMYYKGVWRMPIALYIINQRMIWIRYCQSGCPVLALHDPDLDGIGTNNSMSFCCKLTFSQDLLRFDLFVIVIDRVVYCRLCLVINTVKLFSFRYISLTLVGLKLLKTNEVIIFYKRKRKLKP